MFKDGLDKKHKKILMILFVGVLMGALEISIVGPAIPSIESTIKIDQRSIGWIFSIYVLFQLTGISLFAKLSDLFGRRNIYILSVSIFALGSTVLVFSESFTALLIGRAIQGFGASGIFPVASAVVGDIFPPEKRGAALGMIGAVFGIAFIMGPLIAGVLLINFAWNSLFLINLPLAAALIYGSYKLLPTTKVDNKGKLDYAGIITLAMLLASFAFGINRIESERLFASLMSLEVLPYLFISLILLLVFIPIERKAANPIVKMHMFKSKQIVLVGFIAIGTGIFQSSIVFVPDLAVEIYKVTSSNASFMLLPVVIATAIGSPITGKLIDKFGSRAIVVAGLLISSLALFMLYLDANNIFMFYTSGSILGMGISMLMGPSLRYIMLNEVDARERASTQGILTIFIAIGQISGSAIISAIIAGGANLFEGYRNAFLSLALMVLFLTLFGAMLKSRAVELQEAKK